MDASLIRSHVNAVYKYNLSDHANPQRPTYALGNECGLLLCTWPNGGKLSLPFVYSNEVWTGVRYDAVDHILYIDSKIGDFKSFISTETGFGNVGLKDGKPFITIVYGNLNVKKVMVSGTELKL